MRIIKRLHLFVLKSFLPLFAMTFFIVLFIVLMQFLWKYIDDLVGKGLSMDVLGELFFYAAVSMVPMALPLAILLASLMTFGNFGEKFELTAMKASGISLVRVMKPLIVLITFVAIGAFFFQNNVLPKAQVKMWTLLFSMRQKSPELEIPEGVFYDQIPGYNLFVREKNKDTGMLRDVMIYANPNGSSNTTILLADSAQMATTPDFRYLYLHMFKGEQFENLREQTTSDANVPFRRESFHDKEVLISFDANFNRLDEGGMRNQYVGKNITQLNNTIDSIGLRVDSMGLLYGTDLHYEAFPLLNMQQLANGPERGSMGAYFVDESTTPTVSAVDGNPQAKKKEGKKPQGMKVTASPVNLDTLLLRATSSGREEIFASAHAIVQRHRGELEFRAEEMAAEQKLIRRHQIELIKKFTLSIACLIFFFIGAPLGAIIRKGGLGTPLVISVLLFLVYYIIDNTGYKMARDGHAIVWVGMWLSTFILAPLSIYVTYKAMNDSAVFDKDRYVAIFRRIFGIRQPRSVAYKEVIINDIDPATARKKLLLLILKSRRFAVALQSRVSYTDYWLRPELKGASFAKSYAENPASYITRKNVDKLAKTLNSDIDYMSDSRNLKLIDMLSMYPDIHGRRIYNPVSKRWLARALCIFLPVGFPVYLIACRAFKQLRNDIREIIRITERIEETL
ncbi:MAG: LptF/LptG family permease [Clostridium sp.]|nr:LptF/LptG family permease [Prevotella sp.]MCM1429510.1 LptF/LptG family permease [Clostridium sp.]MCM1476126.1 LptF/LptG family permease [Muribaculaceae bacterium]